MDREAVAQECLRIEKAGGSVLDYLGGIGCISPWGTWFRLQKEQLKRKDWQITEGKGRMNGRFNSQREMALACVAEIEAERDPIVMLGEHGYTTAAQNYAGVKTWAKTNAPDLYAKLPANLRSWKIEHKIGRYADTKAAKQIRFGKAVEVPEKVKVMQAPETPEGGITAMIADEISAWPEVPEEPKITKPVNYGGFEVRAVEGEYGSYHYQDINGKQWLDYDDKECSNQLSMTVDLWRGFLRELREAAKVLGVEL